MKKFASIFLIVLLLFNVVGYRIVFYYEQHQSDKRLEASLDKDLYDESDLLTLKVPLSLPYMADNTTFERVDGEINIDGKIYKYVKRKISEGQLVLLCLPDYNKMRLQSEASESFKNVNGEFANSDSKKSGHSTGISLKNISSEYHKSEISYTTDKYSNQKCYEAHKPDIQIISFPHTTVEHPPEIA